MSDTPANTIPAARNNEMIVLMGPVLLIMGMMYWAYAPNFAQLFWKWSNDPNYSHGYFVAPIAAAILWSRREKFSADLWRPAWLGLVPFGAILGLRAYFYEINEQWLETSTMPFAIAAAAWTLGGWHGLRWCWPALLFMFFLLPMPESINNLLAMRLQGMATVVACGALQFLGMPALSEGNVIFVGTEQLEVARACSGLSMLLTFLTLVAAVVCLVPLSRMQRSALLLSAVPIALISNITRIIVTGVLYYSFGSHRPLFGDWTIADLTHGPAGFAMMPFALLLIVLELKVLSWLMVEEEEADLRRPLLVSQPTPIVPKKA